MQVHRGKVHTYVGMTLNYEYSGEVRISMFKYVEEVIEAFKQAKLSSTMVSLKSGRRKGLEVRDSLQQPQRTFSS